MSKKTIVFKIPSPETAQPDREPAGIETVSLATTGLSEPSGPDRWVQAGEAHELALLHPVGAAARSFPIDLALDRDFSEIAALSFTLPAMLSWFWLTNTLDRYRRIVAS